MSYQTLLVDQQDGIVTVTINRPERRNAVIPEMMHELLDALDKVESDPNARVVILTGAGEAFCSGADLKVTQQWMSQGRDVLQNSFNPYWVRLVHAGFGRLRALPRPVIAAVNGVATAGGCDIALACDIRIASERASFGEGYIKIGLIPAGGGTFFLPRLVGTGWACELIFTGDPIPAAQAEKIGLVNRVVPHDQLLGSARELAAKLAQRPLNTLAAAKAAIYEGQTLDFGAAMASVYKTYSFLLQGDEFFEGTRAFLEKRPPRYGPQSAG
ncbi:MAG: enoyl-CoA hydratase [Chloroflexi bacterium]|nr:enoyl-CoA hydratase [Chloroflexota bacterium]